MPHTRSYLSIASDLPLQPSPRRHFLAHTTSRFAHRSLPIFHRAPQRSCIRWGDPRGCPIIRRRQPDRPNVGAVLDRQQLLTYSVAALSRGESTPIFEPMCGHLPPASARQRGSTPRLGCRRSTSSRQLSTYVAASRTVAPSPSLPAILALDRDSHVRFRAFRTRELGACPRRWPWRRRTCGRCHERTRGRLLDLRRGRCGAPESAL